MSSSDSIFNFGLLALAAYVLWSMGFLKKPTATSSETTAACPRGRVYTRGLFGDCDPNYTVSGWFQEDCKCLTPVPSATTGTEHSPQTPKPKPDPKIEFCIYDPSLLAGDSRCSPQLLPKIQTCPEGTYPTWYGTCEAGAGHL